MNEKDFDLDFDFEKEYGFDIPQDSAQQFDEDFDLKALLESEFGEEADTFVSEYEADFDYGPETVDYQQEEEEEPVVEELPSEEPAEEFFEDEDEFDAELPEEMMEAAPLDEEAPIEPDAEAVQEDVPAQEQPVRRERRKPVSPMRRFKNETLPLIITGVTALLIVIFVIGSLGRLFTRIKLNNEAAIQASEAAQNEAERRKRKPTICCAMLLSWLPDTIMTRLSQSWKASAAIRINILKSKPVCLSTSSRRPCWLLTTIPALSPTFLSIY